MEPYGFLGAWLRLERAREHLAEVRVDADAFFAEERDIGDRVDTLEEGALTIDLREVDVPERLSIVAGEVIANLRSSLDYLIFALAWHDTGHRPSGNWMQKLQFPTSARRRSFRRSAPKQLKGLDSGHVDMVASYLAFSGMLLGARARRIVERGQTSTPLLARRPSFARSAVAEAMEDSRGCDRAGYRPRVIRA
jgi:hypothetical protein